MPDLAIESLRARYRPSCVQVLFVGEAPPANGTFFYDGNTQMFRYVRDALSGHFGHPADFLAEFQRRNYFLDDFVLDPIAQSASRRDCEELFQQWAPSLVARLAEMRPQVMLLMRIAPHVEAARQAAGLDVVHHQVPFPGTGQQGNFRRRMAEIVPSLPCRLA
jgi:hypothetical protein